MKNSITYLKTLWSWGANSQSSDVSHDCRLTVGSPSGMTAKLQVNTFMRFAVVLTLIFTIGIGNVWGAEGDEHTNTDVAFSKSLNYNASIDDIVISDPGYPVKKIVANCRYNKEAGGVTISITIGGNSFGTSQTHNANSTVNLEFTGDAMTGDIVLSFKNNCTSGSGKGTFYLNSVTLVEGPAAGPCTVTFTKTDGSTVEIKEASAGAGVTPPSMDTPCDGWAFQGWSKSQSTEPTSTTVLSTETLREGKYYPSANTTLYPVYTKKDIGAPVETNSQTFTYDTWTYGGSSTDKSSYRLFHTDGYVESASDVDFSKLTKVIVYGGTFGGSQYNGISICKADGIVWKDATVSGSSEKGQNFITDGASLTGSAKLRVYSTSGTATGSGVRISKVEIFTLEAGTTTYYYSYPTCVACDKSLTVKQGTETNGTITLSNSGELESCSALNITVTPSPAAGYQVGEVTATTPSAGGAPTITDNGNGTWTVTYAANSTGSSTINVGFEPLVINILLTSYNDGHIQSCVQEGSATVNYDGTALNDFEPPVRSGFGATPGYWTDPSAGVKVLNADGSFAATDVTGVIVNNHWTNIDNPFTLYARFTCNDTVFVTAASSGNGTTTLNSSYVATCDCEELARQVTITATPNSGYQATSIAYSGDGNPTKVSGPTTSAGVATWVYQYPQSDDGNGTFTVTYAAIPTYTVTWNVNGNASVTSSVTSGNKPTFPSTPASCDDASTTFVGWATAPWSGKIANLTGKTVYTSADDMPAVEGPVTYYAVWANGGAAEEQWVQCTSLDDFVADDYYLFVSPKYNNTYYYVPAVSAAATQGTFSSTDVGNHVASNTTPTNITQAQGAWKLIQSGSAWKLQSKNATTIYLYTGTNNNKLGAATSGTASSTWTITKHATENTFAFKYNNSRYLCAYNTSPYGFRTYTSTSTNGTAYLTVYHWTTGSTATDYVTTCCSEVEEPSVTVECHATYAVLTWPHQTNAVSYTATCSGGSVGSITGGDTRSCTITGLTVNTAYTYTVTAEGSSCSQTAAGGFTTADCDDVPVINSAVATTTTITFNWTCTSNNSTIYIYSDENYLREVRRKATTHATTAKTDTVAGLESGVTYYYKILSDNTCASEGGSVVTLESKITIAEWDTCGVYLDLGDIQGAIAIVENQNTQATVQQKYAKGLFFSKYFEAYQNVKLWAVYNGTENKISLADVKVLVGSNGKGWGYNGDTPNATQATTELSGYGHTETGWIYPGEEIIVYNSGSTATDGSIMACAENENANFKDWYKKTNNTTAFSGDDGLILIQGTDTIDVIGGMNIATAYTKTVKKSWNDAKGWWCENGQDMDGNSIQLSTNRCLLVRKNTVEDGLNAVALNKDSFNTLCSEWVGTQVATGGNEINASCLGFTYVGNYDYNQYYAKYDTIQKNIELDDIRQDDGTYFIKISQLDTMSCTNLRIVVTTTEGEKLTGSWKIPIFVTNDKATVQTSDEVFTKEGEDCATCDVVVLRKANLQVVDGGKNTIRNIEVYPTATLDVPTGKTYNINSIIMRSKDDAVSRANVIGTLTPTIKNVYLDKRITATRVYKFSLPYACNIADVTWRSGEKAVYGTDWILRWYDGDRRANGTQNGNWKLFTGSTIQPGVGYDLVINSDVLEPKNKYAELRFPMAIGGDNVTSPAEVSVPVKAYGANNSRKKDGQPVTPNHLGWNLIGNPYLNDYTKNHMPNDLTEGALSIVDDKYVLTKNGLRYLVVPTYAGSTTYQQVNMAITDMEPFTAYFVQIDGESDNQELNVVFSLSNVAGRSAVRSRLPVQEYEEDNHIVWYAIDMSNNGGKKDETTLLISNRFNDKFEMMDDMHKIRNAGQSIIATRNDDGEMVFNALPDSSAAVKGVPVHYYAAEAGDYTISTSANYSLEEVAEAWLFDKTTGQYTNLLTDNYRFATAAGNNTDRFTLFVRVERKKAPEVATGNDNILTDGQLSLTAIDRTLVLSGLTENADVYVYDMSGKLLRGERANGNGIWRATVPAQGVYFVRVNSAGGQQTLRTIVK